MIRHRSRSLFALLVAAAVVQACGRSPAPPAEVPADTMQRARDLALGSIIVDTHIDVPYRLEEGWVDVSQATEGGDFDYPRAVAGGLNAPFMSIYTPAAEEEAATARATADRLIDMVQRIVAQSPEKFAVALTPDDVERQFAAGLISLPMGMENGAPIAGDLDNLRYFYDRGIRYITLTHSLSNHIADSSYDENKRWGGLSEFGERVVAEMNRLGIMVDISHASDEAFYDALEISEAPMIASHSSSRKFTPGWERNISDDMASALAAKGGIIMVNFGSSFITGLANRYSQDRTTAWRAMVDEQGIEPTEEARDAFDAAYVQEHGPFPYADIADVLDHFDHLVEVAGIDHVGIGSDFDGVGDSLPTGLKDVSAYPNLVQGFIERGYDDDAIRKILGQNLLRVWREVESHAAGRQEDRE